MRGPDEQDAHWGVFDVEEVDDVIAQTVRSLSFEYDFIEVDDWIQDARMLVATKPDLYGCVLGDEIELGLLQYRLRQDLVDMARVEKDRRKRNTSFEERYDERPGADDYAPRPVTITVRRDTVAYDRPLVEALLPAVWDEAFCYGIRMENAPDQDMPRGSINKATGNTLAAHIADIKTGWADAPLTLGERRALLLGYGLDWKQTEIAFNQDVSQKTVSKRLETGVGKIVNTLNGTDNPEWYDDDN